MRVLLPCFALITSTVAAEPVDFRKQIAPIFETRCVRCHQGVEPKGGLDLTSAKGLRAGGDSGAAIDTNRPAASTLIEYVTGEKPAMPAEGSPLTASQVTHLKQWIADGAKWPDGLTLQQKNSTDWWSLQPLVVVTPRQLPADDEAWCRNPIDRFIRGKQREHRLSPAPQADRRTLIRRLYFDLLGLPPTPDAIERFVNDPAVDAYEKLVDRLLASPRFGERWARHWLDAVHYADTHGFDKDKLRPHAWPYRDYVIRSFNGDKAYPRFVREQLAGDRLYPGTRDGIVALGFIASGPFDWVGQIELREGSTDKKITRNLDRDDMVSVTLNTFVSLTAQCARCHNHKFDPISQEDYYSLQAVFAAVDRADRPYDLHPDTAERRNQLIAKRNALTTEQTRLHAEITKLGGANLKDIDAQLVELSNVSKSKARPEFGYHSKLERQQDINKWAQVDLGKPMPIREVVVVGCHDDFNNIGAGFGFPVRYKIEASNDAAFANGVAVIVDRTAADVPNPGIEPQRVEVKDIEARYVRVTATKLAPRLNDYMLALAELIVRTPEGTNAAAGKQVTSLDSIEAPVRWTRKNLTDGYYMGRAKEDHTEAIAQLQSRRRMLIEKTVPKATRTRLENVAAALKHTVEEIRRLPKQQMVFAAATSFAPRGNFKPTAGEPRSVHVLNRGSIKQPLQKARPGTVGCFPQLPSRFALSADHHEAERRAALAEWIVSPENPLTWRSIANRVWQHHFGRGLVATPNDFGRMGTPPTHPELLDWLADEVRKTGSLKRLHRLILTSATYRQQSTGHPQFAEIDAGNRYLWKMNRRRLEAESLRDAVLAVSGSLTSELGGPGFRAFGFKDDHSPHYKYREHDPHDAATHRRSVYRFVVRSVPDPFMATLDCPDPSLIVARRNETVTPLQALALLNNRFMVAMSERFAARLRMDKPRSREQVARGFQLTTGRAPTERERRMLVEYTSTHGLENTCRLLFNTNEFVFVD